MRDELWIKHDARSRFDPKMARFLKRAGMFGYGVFWSLIEYLHYQNDHELDLNTDFEGIADQLRIEPHELQTIVEHLLEIGLLRMSGTRIYQVRLKEEQAKRSKTKQKISEIRAEAGRKGGQASGNTRKKGGGGSQNGANFASNFASSETPSKTGRLLQENSNDSNNIEANAKQNEANPYRGERVDISIQDPTDLVGEKREAKPQPPPLTKYGDKFLSMEPTEFGKLVAKFGEPLVRQEIPDADLWIERSDTPNGRKYRRPNYNHYLFFNGWLKDKRLRNGSSSGRRGSALHASGFSEHFMNTQDRIRAMEERERLEEENRK